MDHYTIALNLNPRNLPAQEGLQKLEQSTDTGLSGGGGGGGGGGASSTAAGSAASERTYAIDMDGTSGDGGGGGVMSDGEPVGGDLDESETEAGIWSEDGDLTLAPTSNRSF